MTDAEFIALSETMIIKGDKRHEKRPDGKRGPENGWRFEQGGYPPLAYKLPFADFPKDCWVTFEVRVEWARYGREAEAAEGGKLDVVMSYEQAGVPVSKSIVDNMDVLVGRNDHKGYYFKFGIYRADGSAVPAHWNLAGYQEKQL